MRVDAVSVGSVSHFNPNVWEHIRKNKGLTHLKPLIVVTFTIASLNEWTFLYKDWTEKKRLV